MSDQKSGVDWRAGGTIHEEEWESLLPQKKPLVAQGPQEEPTQPQVNPSLHSSYSPEPPPAAPPSNRVVNRLFRSS